MGAIIADIPEIVWWGLGALGIGVGVKEAADGAQSTSNTLVNTIIVAGVVYYLAKKVKVI